MPVFRKDGVKVLFIHVPKTGGSSIERVFKASDYDTLYLDGRVGPKSWNHVRRCTPQHMHAAMLDMLFREERFDHVFMVVRDPVARLRSEYLWRNRNTEFEVDGRAVERWAKETLGQYRVNPFVYDNHIRPQVEFQLPSATVFRFEDGLESVIEHLNLKWSLGIVTDLPRIREGHTTTNYSSKDVEVTPGLEERIREFYADDVERYGYGVT